MGRGSGQYVTPQKLDHAGVGAAAMGHTSGPWFPQVVPCLERRRHLPILGVRDWGERNHDYWVSVPLLGECALVRLGPVAEAVQPSRHVFAPSSKWAVFQR